MRLPRALGRLLLATGSTLVVAAAIDLWMRSRVGACGITPFRESPIEGVPHEFVAGRTTTYKGVTVRIDAAGFRGPELVDPPEGTERIVLVGDSVAFGNGCPEEETLPAWLERELAGRGHPAQVVNAGVSGFNAGNVSAYARARVLPLRPGRIVWILISNDVSKSLRKTAIPAGATIDAFGEFPLGSPLLQFLGNQGSALLRRLGVAREGYVEQILAASKEGGMERVARSLTELRDACRDAGIGFSVAIYPYLVRADRNPFRDLEDEFARRCGELGIPCTKLAEAFAPDEELQRYWVSFLDGHPDGAANRKAAALLAERLLRP
jgi:lysophospholipase L1-like esterase